MAKKLPGDVPIGKFDILATYTYAQALLDGMTTTRRSSGEWSPPSLVLRHAWHSQGTSRGVPSPEGSRREEEKDHDHRRIVRQAGRSQDGRDLQRRVLPTMKKLVEAGLSSCVMDAEIPVPVVTPHGVTQGVLATHLELGDPAPNGGIDREYLSPRLGFGDRVLTSRG